MFSEPAGGWTNATQTRRADCLRRRRRRPTGRLGGGLGLRRSPPASILHSVGANSEQGAVYVFSEPAGGWKNAYQTAELTASDGAAGDHLGDSVSISGGSITVGAPEHTRRRRSCSRRGVRVLAAHLGRMEERPPERGADRVRRRRRRGVRFLGVDLRHDDRRRRSPAHDSCPRGDGERLRVRRPRASAARANQCQAVSQQMAGEQPPRHDHAPRSLEPPGRHDLLVRSERARTCHIRLHAADRRTHNWGTDASPRAGRTGTTHRARAPWSAECSRSRATPARTRCSSKGSYRAQTSSRRAATR